MKLCRRIAVGVVAMLSLTLLTARSFADDGQAEAPKMVLTTTEHDFGLMALGDAPRSFDFEFTNMGNAPLVVIRTQTSCSCIKVVFPKKPIKAGEKGVICVTYNPNKDAGAFSKGIHIFTNSAERQQTVVVRGVVEQKRNNRLVVTPEF